MAVCGEKEIFDIAFFTRLERSGGMCVISFCMSEGLITDRYECPKCGRNMNLIEWKQGTDGFTWICRSSGQNAHNVKRSVRRGTWFGESKLSITQILMITYFWITKATNLFISNEIKIVPRTLVDWKSFCRGLCVELCMGENAALGGPGVIVDIDESEFVKRKQSRGHREIGKWMYYGVERESKKCFLEVVESRSTDTLLVVIKKYILPGTTVVSDCWKAYNCLQDPDFVNFTVNHAVTLKNPSTAAEVLWSTIKKELYIQRHRRCRDEKPLLIAEFLWRKMHEGEDTDTMFQAFLEGMKSVYTPSTKDHETE